MEEEILKKKDSEEVNNNSNKNGIIAVLVVIIIALIGAVIYFAFIKKNDKPVDNNDEIISNAEAIKIAKEKLELANTNNLIGDTCFDGKEHYSEEGSGSMFCYYDTIDGFKDKFYNVYSSKLEYKDVFVEYDMSLEKSYANFNLDRDISALPKYAIKDNKVYTSGCTTGTGSYNRMDKFVVDSITADTIKINYVVIGNSSDILEESEEYEYSKPSMTLVKENGDWKILKATIVNMCHGVYEVGK